MKHRKRESSLKVNISSKCIVWHWYSIFKLKNRRTPWITFRIILLLSPFDGYDKYTVYILFFNWIGSIFFSSFSLNDIQHYTNRMLHSCFATGTGRGHNIHFTWNSFGIWVFPIMWHNIIWSIYKKKVRIDIGRNKTVRWNILSKLNRVMLSKRWSLVFNTLNPEKNQLCSKCCIVCCCRCCCCSFALFFKSYLCARIRDQKGKNGGGGEKGPSVRKCHVNTFKICFLCLINIFCL